MRVLIERLPSGAALYRELDVPAAWDEKTHLLATLADNGAWDLYQRAKIAGAKGVKEPKPLHRPGMAPQEDTTTMKGESMTIEQATEWLGLSSN